MLKLDTTIHRVEVEQQRYDRDAPPPDDRIDLGRRRRALAGSRQAVHPKRECRRRRPA
jgi:hypothetical protein